MSKITIPVQKFKQGNRTAFVASLSFSQLNQFVQTTDHSQFPPEQRAQRVLNQKHALGIREYVVTNPEDFIIPPIILNTEQAEFRENSKLKNFGELIIESASKNYLIDGQHRVDMVRWICESLPDSPLLNDQVLLIIYVGLSLADRQSIFITINTTAKRVPSATVVNIGHDPVSSLTRDVLASTPRIAGGIERTRPSVPRTSSLLFTILAVRRAIHSIIPNPGKDLHSSVNHAAAILADLDVNMRIWDQVRAGATNLREDTYACHPMVLEALVNVVHDLAIEIPDNWKQFTARIEQLNFRKITLYHQNDLFAGLVNENGRLVDRRDNLRMLIARIREELV